MRGINSESSFRLVESGLLVTQVEMLSRQLDL